MALAGCQTPLSHVLAEGINLGIQLNDDMRHLNVAGVVEFDEAWVGDYRYVQRNLLYNMGVKSGAPEYGMRVARVNMRHPAYGAWVSSGQKVWPTAAMVPDHIGPLKANDYVEIRQTGTWRIDENFVATGEGNIVLRVLCRAAQPDYAACVKTLPRIGKYSGFGATGTLYPASSKEYGFTFTPRYDKDTGKPLH